MLDPDRVPNGGKSYRYDAFNIDEKLRAGQLTQDELNHAISERRLSFESVDIRALAPSVAP